VEDLYQPGDRIGDRYQILKPLGKGGTGTTYAAQDQPTQETVAIKAISLRQVRDWKTLDLFEREAKILANLSHPAIPNYIDYFNIDTPQDRQFFLVRELIEGDSLADLVETGWRTNEETVKAIATQILDVLTYLHGLAPPVIHRDIKPQNIIRKPDGQVVLVDFGAVQDAYRATISKGSTFVGTLGYMPPEQFRGQVVPASDLYALGATLVYLLTGRSPDELPQVRLKPDIRPLLSTTPAFTMWLEQMLEPAVEDRFQTAAAALAALNQERLPISAARALTKPHGSRITLSRTRDRLTINVPPGGITSENTGMLFFALFWNMFVLFWTFGAAAGSVFFALFSIPFWMIGLGMLYASLMSMASRFRLTMDWQTFRLEWSVLGLKRVREGQTRNLTKAEVYTNSNIKFNDRPVVTCALKEGVRAYHFGNSLDASEREWLVAEITTFLNQFSR
jgi:serine/threonine protein kinase